MPATTHSAPQHQPVEIRFRSTVDYPEPFRDAQLDVVFSAPGGTVRRVPAFWAGGNDWRVRFSAVETGVHRFQTQCSDPGNAGLHGQTGEVHVGPAEGDNPLHRHGGLRIAADRRHFCHADGTPFFWLGDTWWMGLCGRLSWPEEFQALAENRKALGFNVIQLVAGLYPDMPLFDPRGRSASGFCWDTGLRQVNPAFFDEADRRIFHLVGLGLTPCILGAWGYYLPMIGLDNMQRHWRHLMARWGALPVVWAAAGEQTLPWYLEGPEQKVASSMAQQRDWSLVIAHMRSLNAFDRPISTHPFASARESVSDPALIDFEMQQTGHGQPTPHHARRAWQGWNGSPVMPVISAESRYEGLEVQPLVTARDAREAFWAHTLASGVAGHTYGANGVWQVNTPDQPFGPSPSGFCWGNTPWQQAMALPGARHLAGARAFLETLPWPSMAPLPVREGWLERVSQARPRLRRVLHRLGWRETPTAPVAVAVAREHRVALAYTVTERPFDLALDLPGVAWTARWVDPTSFEAHPAGQWRPGSALRFRPDRRNAAGDGDWLLLLESDR